MTLTRITKGRDNVMCVLQYRFFQLTMGSADEISGNCYLHRGGYGAAVLFPFSSCD